MITNTALPSPQFTFSRYIIRAFQAVPKKRRVYAATFPRFRDRQDLATYRKVWLERIAADESTRRLKKPDPYNEAVLQLLDALDEYLFQEIDL